MKILYIGHYSDGSTSKMRGQYLKTILQAEDFIVANTDVPMQQTGRILRSLGWRYKIGPFISNINSYIKEIIAPHQKFDLAWIDKGVFVKPELVAEIRKKSTKLIHFTPDPAFTYHQSSLFYKAIPYYDFCITTKSFELEQYAKNHSRSTLYCTQGFDPTIHKPYHSYQEKKGIVFIGHKEPDREEIIAKLIEKGYLLKLAGINWEKLANRYKNYPNLEYHGKGVFGKNYAKMLSGSLIGLGFLSKIIPEQHTTRTFEIPACGTALLTERNADTNAIFQEDEVLFFADIKEIFHKIQFVMDNLDTLHDITEKGSLKIISGSYTYESILKNLLKKMNLLTLTQDK